MTQLPKARAIHAPTPDTDLHSWEKTPPAFPRERGERGEKERERAGGEGRGRGVHVACGKPVLLI